MLLPRFLDTKVRELLEKKGYVRVRGSDPAALARRSRLLESQHIDLMIDVGANIGQFSAQVRELGYKGRIHSFEPMQHAWDQLRKRMANDTHWTGSKLALGNEVETKSLHISTNSISSSLLAMLPKHLANAPGSVYVGEELVHVSRLDDEFQRFGGGARNIWLKLDVQGYELNVLQGGLTTLRRSRIVQVEMSLTPLYAGQPTFRTLNEYLADAGFDPIGFEAGFQELETGVLLQVDGLFRHRSSAALATEIRG
jgi:FkbM family methyltransferase